ncbi:MAG: spoIIP [Oscillospiraceae bacterium]|nr:spoIIP [Oscillospiraceae bacterium]
MRKKRMRTRVKNKYKKAACCLLVLVMVPTLFKLMIASLPYLSVAASKAAIISAGFSMPEGGALLINDAINTTTSTDNVTLDASNSQSSDFVSSAEPSSSKVTSSQKTSSQTALTSSSSTSKPKNTGTVIRKHYTAGSTSIYVPLKNGAYIKNVTKLSVDKIKAEVTQKPVFKITKGSSPQVLIMHTHTTESYEPTARNFYDKSYNSRSTDNNKNMVRVADEIEKQLKSAGIGVLHDTTKHDYPSYTGSYDRSVVTVKNYLKKYPSIKVVLDVHRDAIQQQDGTRIAPVVKINGKNAAQVMIISGCDDGTMNYPNYFKNLRFSSMLQSQMEGDYKGLTRPILFDYRKYNQNLTTGSILLEMGSSANSLDEAVYTGQLVGKSLVKTLNALK